MQSPNWTETDLNYTKLIGETKLENFLYFIVDFCSEDFKARLCLKTFVSKRFGWQIHVLNNAENAAEMFEVLDLPTRDIIEWIKEEERFASKVRLQREDEAIE